MKSDNNIDKNLLSYSTSLRFLATVLVSWISVSPVRSTRGGRRVVAVTLPAWLYSKFYVPRGWVGWG